MAELYTLSCEDDAIVWIMDVTANTDVAGGYVAYAHVEASLKDQGSWLTEHNKDKLLGKCPVTGTSLVQLPAQLTLE